MYLTKDSNYLDKKTSGLTNDQTKIKRLIKQREIEWLCHYTPRANLESIKKQGLRLRDPSCMIVTEDPRTDNSNNICLSISEPNYEKLFDKVNNNYDLVLLLINPKILFYKKCLFYPYHPAAEPYRSQEKKYFLTAQALGDMFTDIVIYQKDDEQKVEKIMRRNNKPDYLTTSKQAEVQIQVNIAPEYILHICEGDIPTNYLEIRTDIDNTNLKKLNSLGESKFNHLFKVNRIRKHKKYKRKGLPKSLGSIIKKVVLISIGLVGIMFTESIF